MIILKLTTIMFSSVFDTSIYLGLYLLLSYIPQQDPEVYSAKKIKIYIYLYS